MWVSIVPMTSEEEAKSKACVHRAARKQTYRAASKPGLPRCEDV